MLSMWFFSKVLVVEETIEDTITMCISMLIKDVQISVPQFSKDLKVVHSSSCKCKGLSTETYMQLVK